VQTLRRTPLHDRHVALGARMVPFAGWDMPVQYEGVIQEHRAVRERVGLLDLTSFGKVELVGPGAVAALRGLGILRRRTDHVWARLPDHAFEAKVGS
jgi:aminomethyltransferase